jgi:hypothetical protein
MNDEFDHEEELYDEEPEALVTIEPVDRASYVAVIHDSFGEHYVNVALMRERAPAVSVLRILRAMNPEPKGEVQYLRVLPQPTYPLRETALVLPRLRAVHWATGSA